MPDCSRLDPQTSEWIHQTWPGSQQSQSTLNSQCPALHLTGHGIQLSDGSDSIAGCDWNFDNRSNAIGASISNLFLLDQGIRIKATLAGQKSLGPLVSSMRFQIGADSGLLGLPSTATGGDDGIQATTEAFIPINRIKGWSWPETVHRHGRCDDSHASGRLEQHHHNLWNPAEHHQSVRAALA